ncbi:MAG: NUDIX hydrolase [Elusimicrobia bacterium]|nr:NUDIX hydrolase [Elusimicrobiota bacterium]
MTETLIKRKRVYAGAAVDFRVDTVRLPNDRLATREFLDHPGAVGVVAFLDPGHIVLVRQYRHPVGETTLELPAGKLDPGESVTRCIKRELREETGYSARRIRPLVNYWPTPAFASELLYLFVAEGLIPGRFSPDPDEFLQVVTVPFQQALQWVRSGKIKDSKTVIGLLACALWRRSSR